MRAFMLNLVLWVSLVFPEQTRAQPLLQRVAVDSQAEWLFLGSQSYVLFDAEEQLSWEQLTREAAWSAAAPATNPLPNFGFRNGAVWSLVPIINRTAGPLQRFVHFDNPIIEHVDIFLVQDDKLLTHIQERPHQPMDARHIGWRSPLYPLEIPSGQSMLMFRIKSDSSLNFPLHIRDAAGLRTYQVENSIILTLAYGILLAMIVYNLFLAISLLNPTYMVYVSFVALSTFNFASLQGINHLWLPFLDRLTISHSLAFVGHMTVILAIWFGNQFLGLKQALPRTYRVSQLIMVLAAVGLGIMAFSYQPALKLFLLLSMSTSWLLLYAGIRLCLRAYRPAYYFTAAWSVVLIGHIALALFTMGVLPANPISTWGAFFGSAMEVLLLSLALGDRFAFEQRKARLSISKLNDDLAKERDHVVQLNQGLETLVDEKTRNIRSILQHIRQGIFTIESQGGELGQEKSAYLQDLLPEASADARTIDRYLLALSELRSDQQEQVMAAIQACLHEDQLAFELNESKFPRKLEIRTAQSIKILEVDWNPIIDQAGKVARLLLCLRDVTLLKALEADVKAKDEDFAKVRNLVELGQSRYQKIREQFAHLLDPCLQLKRGSKLGDDGRRALAINLHTMKGLARGCGFLDLADLIHRLEGRIRPDDRDTRPAEWSTMLEQVENLLAHYQHLSQTYLNWQGEAQGVSLAKDYLESLLLQIPGIMAEKPLPSRSFLEKLEPILLAISSDLTALLADAERGLASVARELGKSMPEMALQVLGTRYNDKANRLFPPILGHLLRNSLDHGLETDEQRRISGKAARGRISICEVMDGQGLALEYYDDGCGLDLLAIKAAALQHSPDLASRLLTDQDLAEAIFLTGLTTKAEATLISGRGFGLDAVKSLWEEAGGQVAIELGAALPQGRRAFKVRLRVPADCYWPMTAEIGWAKTA
jgi:hypothetical protein